MIIGLTGTFACGKGTVGEMLVEQGFGFISLSDMLRQEATKQGRSLDRVELSKIGEELRRKHGPSVLADLAVTYMKEHPKEQYVVDSIRNVEEVRRLRKKEKNFFLASVDAPIEIRYERERQRKRENAGTLEEFKAREARESSGNPYFMQLRECMKIADFHIENDSTIDALREHVRELIERASQRS